MSVTHCAVQVGRLIVDVMSAAGPDVSWSWKSSGVVATRLALRRITDNTGKGFILVMGSKLLVVFMENKS